MQSIPGAGLVFPSLERLQIVVADSNQRIPANSLVLVMLSLRGGNIEIKMPSSPVDLDTVVVKNNGNADGADATILLSDSGIIDGDAAGEGISMTRPWESAVLVFAEGKWNIVASFGGALI